MLKQTLKWELKHDIEWSDHPDGYYYKENPELDEKRFWTEAHLKEELEELNHFAHTKGFAGVKELIEYLLEHNWVYESRGEELISSYDFVSVKKLCEKWESCRDQCKHYKHVYYDMGEFNVRCYAKKGESGCGVPESDWKNCKLFKSYRTWRSFIEITKEVSHS